MNKKVSKKVILVANFSHAEVAAIKAFPSYRMKDAKLEIEYYKNITPASIKDSVDFEAGLITVTNDNFKLILLEMNSRYYGAQFKCRIYSEEFEKYPGWGWNERQFIVHLDYLTMSSILQNRSVIEGMITGEYVIDTLGSSWYLTSTPIMFSDDPGIPDFIKNYDEFYEAKMVSNLEPGSVYVDRHGDLYLSLATDIYSKIYGNGYNSYIIGRHWGMANPDGSLEKTNIMVHLENRDLLSNTITDLRDFCDNIITETFKYLGSYSCHSPIRIKKTSSGKFAKIGELAGYKEHCESASWSVIREELIDEIEKAVPKGSGYQGLFDHLALFMTFEENQFSTLSPSMVNHFRNFYIHALTEKRNNPGWRDKENYPELYSPTREMTDKEIEQYFKTSVPRTSYTPTLEQLFAMGVFSDYDDARNLIDKVRGWKK